MKIDRLLVNRRVEPMGIDAEAPLFSFCADGEGIFIVAIYAEDEKTAEQERVVSFSERVGFRFAKPLRTGIRYRWRVSYGNEHADSFFETGVFFSFSPICVNEADCSPVYTRCFHTPLDIVRARLYICSSGYDRPFLNGKRVGNLYFTGGARLNEGVHAYQTYDVTDLLVPNAENRLSVLTLKMGAEPPALAVGLVISSTKGGVTVIETDENWRYYSSGIRVSVDEKIEEWDYLKVDPNLLLPVVTCDFSSVPLPQDGAVISAQGMIYPTVVHAENRSMLLDFGESFSGTVRVRAKLPCGGTLRLRYTSEWCGKEKIREDLDTTVYVSDGTPRTYEPMLFHRRLRYVWVEGADDLSAEQFEGVVLSVDLPDVGTCVTDSQKINTLTASVKRMHQNAMLSFLARTEACSEDRKASVPIQANYLGACYNSDCYSFLTGYLRALRMEQLRRCHSEPPRRLLAQFKDTVLLPWMLWRHYADRELLLRYYPMMRECVESELKWRRTSSLEKRIDAFDECCRLKNADDGTEPEYVNSAYLYYALRLVVQAAEILDIKHDAATYAEEGRQTRAELLREYFTSGGRIAIDTQTGYILALAFDFAPDRKRCAKDLRMRLKKDGYRLTCGSPGAPFAFSVMLTNGLEEEAYRILFQGNWEDWRHSRMALSSGAVCESLYRDIAGLRCEEAGWGRAVIAPRPNWRMKRISCSFVSPSGEYRSAWRIGEDGKLHMEFLIPSGCSVQVFLPNGEAPFWVGEGLHSFAVRTKHELLRPFGIDTPLMDLLENEQAKAMLTELAPCLFRLGADEIQSLNAQTLREVCYRNPSVITPECLEELALELHRIIV